MQEWQDSEELLDGSHVVGASRGNIEGSGVGGAGIGTLLQVSRLADQGLQRGYQDLKLRFKLEEGTGSSAAKLSSEHDFPISRTCQILIPCARLSHDRMRSEYPTVGVALNSANASC